MGVAAVTFAICAGIVLGIYWAFVVHPEERAARALRRRLTASPADRPQRTELTKTTPPLSAVRALDALLVRSGAAVQPLNRQLALAALPVTVGVVLLASALGGSVAFLAVWFTTALAWLGLLTALCVASLPFLYVRRAAGRRLARLEEQFPQSMDLIAVSLRAGHAFTTGLLMVAEELGDPLGAEYRVMYDQQNYGKPLPDVLKEFAIRVPLLDTRIFVTAVLTQRETGGNLAEVLDRLSALIRERFTIRRQVRAVSAHGRITGWVLVFMPPVVAGLLFLVAPMHMTPLVQDPLGLQLVGGALALQVLGTLAIRRIVNIEV